MRERAGVVEDPGHAADHSRAEEVRTVVDAHRVARAERGVDGAGQARAGVVGGAAAGHRARLDADIVDERVDRGPRGSDRERDVAVDDQLRGRADAVVDAIALAAAGDVPQPHPGAVADRDCVHGSAQHPELVASDLGTETATGQCNVAVVEDVQAGQVDDVARGQRQGVVAGVGDEVDALDAVQTAIGTGASDLRQVEGGRARHAQGVHAGATGDPGELTTRQAGRQRRDVAGVEHKHVVTSAAEHDVGTATTDERVVAGAGDEGLGDVACRRHAVKRVVAATADEVRRGGELGAAEDDVGPAATRAGRSTRLGGTDEQVGEAIAVDVTSRRNRATAGIAGTLTLDGEAALAIGDG